jgi:hypothetical protein
MSNRPTFSFAALAFCMLAACATQSGAKREPNGISVAVAPDAKCDHRGSASAPMPDAQMCSNVLAAFGPALSHAGFTVGGSGAGVLQLHVYATQDSSGESPRLSVEVRVRRGNDELDVVGGQTDDLTGGADAKIDALLGSLANDLADSPRLKSSVASAR